MSKREAFLKAYKEAADDGIDPLTAIGGGAAVAAAPILTHKALGAGERALYTSLDPSLKASHAAGIQAIERQVAAAAAAGKPMSAGDVAALMRKLKGTTIDAGRTANATKGISPGLVKAGRFAIPAAVTAVLANVLFNKQNKGATP